MFLLAIILFISINNSLTTNPFIEDLKVPQSNLGEFCGYDSCTRVKPGSLNVHLVPSTHAELGHLKQFDEYYSGGDSLNFYLKSKINMKQTLDSIVAELWASANRKFTFADLPYFFHWWSRRDNTIKRMVYELVRQGRLVFVGGGWGLNDECTTNYQSIIDSFTYGLRRLNDTFGECGRPLVAWQAESYGHSREMASLLALMGHDGMFINPISYDDELERMANKAFEMIWRGNDDLGMKTDMFTGKLFDGFWSPKGFCFDSQCTKDPTIVDSDNTLGNIEERVKEFIRVSAHRQGTYFRTRNIMMIMGCRHGYYNARHWFKNIERLIEHVNNRGINHGVDINLFYSTPYCYLRAIYNANPELPTKQDDFLPLAQEESNYYNGLYTSRPTLKYMERVANVFFQIAKQMQVTANLKSNFKILNENSWILGVIQDHNIITGAHRQYVSDYYKRRLYLATQRATNLIRQATNALRGSPSNTRFFRCPFNASECRNTIAQRSYIVVYNPLAWPVTVPIRLPVVDTEYNVYDCKGNLVEARLLPIPEPVRNLPLRATVANIEIVFMAKDLPPLGYRSYFIELLVAKKRVPKSPKLIKKIDKNRKQKLYLVKQLIHRNDFADKDRKVIKRGDGDVLYVDEVARYKDNIKDNLTSKAEIIETNDVSEEFEDTTNAHNMSNAGGSEFNYRPTLYENYTSIDSNASLVNEAETTTIEVEETESETPSSRGSEEIDEYEIDYVTERLYTSPAMMSTESYIRNKYIKIMLDKNSHKITKVVLSNGIEISLDIQFLYYEAYAHTHDNTYRRSSGAYIFKPSSGKPLPIYDNMNSKIYKCYLGEEIHIEYSDFASVVLRLYQDLAFIEVDWVVGPVPIDDKIGKEVIIRYSTGLNNDKTFYTDSNGRQTIKRRVNERASYKYTQIKPVVGNYYPVTSKIYIEDLERDVRFSVFNDRSQGGGSLYNGEIELMLHRRLLSEESNLNIILNETLGNTGLIVRGKHYIYISKPSKYQYKVFEKKLAKEIQLPPQILVSRRDTTDDLTVFKKYKNEFTALKDKLPLGIHLLSLEPWHDKSILLRLENFLEKSDIGDAKTKKVDLRKLFVNIKVKDVKETTLGANIWKENFNPLQWRTESRFVKNFNNFYGGNGTIEYVDDEVLEEGLVDWRNGVRLAPMEIKTFIIYYDYVK